MGAKNNGNPDGSDRICCPIGGSKPRWGLLKKKTLSEKNFISKNPFGVQNHRKG